MGLIEINLGGAPAGNTRRPTKSGFDMKIITRAGAALSGIMSVLVIIMGFIAAFLAESPGYAMLGAGMICLPIALALAVFAWVLWRM